MSLFDQYKTNKSAETDGIWTEFDENKDGSVPGFKLARMSKTNKAYSKALERKTKAHRRKLKMSTLSEELAQKIEKEIFIESILKDWRNVQNEDGSEIPFTRENANVLFETLPDLFDELSGTATDMSNFRDEAIEEESGN